MTFTPHRLSTAGRALHGLPNRRAPFSGLGHAVVIGGGMAGALAAWALRGYADTVTVIERDRYPAEPEFRPGTPQALHAHIFLEGGHRALEAMMPGIRAQLLVGGATAVKMSGELRWLASHGWLAEHETDLTGLCATRHLLDHVVRARVDADASVRFLDGHEVVGLVGSARTVTGVRLRVRGEESRRTDSSVATELPAELVVDASGRRSHMPRWLADLGCEPVREQFVDAGIAYTSRLFQRPAQDPGWRAVYLQTRAPDQPTTGALMPVEGDRWLVSLGGMNGAQPRQGEAGFDDMLARLRDPIVREVLREAEPVGRVSGFRPGASVRRDYTAASIPDGIVVLGDAATAVNPIYAQGLTAAVVGATALREAVVRHDSIEHPAARAARRAIASATRTAWLLSTSEDARFPDTTAPANAMIRLQHRVMDLILLRATTDPMVSSALQQVVSMVASPATLFHPRVLASVLREWR